MAINVPGAGTTRQKDTTVFVDLTQRVKSAQIVRRGYQVPAAKVDSKQVEKIIGDYQVVDARNLPRVVSQSVAAGTRVAEGTAVDLVLAPKSSVVFDMFEGIHTAFKGKSVDQFDVIANNTEARKTLLTYENPQDVPNADKNALISLFGANGVPIDETKTDTGFNAAFNAMRSAMAYTE
ncbi:MAG TPA: hypothetical protein VGQ19_11415 [Burkholderiales bacterium]|nr:hypothetical protein [Burkholderiales bacterium]